MITIPAQIIGVNSRADLSWKITINTQELTPTEIGMIGAMQNKVCFVAINPDPFTSQQREAIKKTKVEINETGKTASQRLRGVLFIAWQQDNGGFKEFHDFYIQKMEAIINHYKSKLL